MNEEQLDRIEALIQFGFNKLYIGVVAILIATLLSGCTHVSAQEYTNGQLTSNIDYTTAGRNVDLSDIQWQGNTLKQGHGQVSPEFAEAMKAWRMVMTVLMGGI